MNALDTTNDPPAQPVPLPETPAEPPAELSVADHAKQFGPQATKPTEVVIVETPAEQEAREHHSAQQRRDTETQQFKEGKVRHRAKSQQAGPEDVGRIGQLTARAKTAEERLAVAEAEVTRLRTQHAPAAQVARAEERVEQAQARVPAPATDPEPKEEDPKYGGDYGKYLIDNARWAARDERRQELATERRQAEQGRVQQAHQQTLKSWGTRTAAAKEKYQDFEAVAFGPTTIPSGSPVDAWIMEDDAGADILYHLQSQPEELDEILRLPVLQQVKRLSLLSQRFSSSTSSPAGTTGSAAVISKVVLPPRPPNPVRTEVQRASDDPPLTDGSLSIAEHAKHFGPQRR